MMNSIPTRRVLKRNPAPRKQGGVVLFIALIALVALTLAGIAIMRSVDTGNVIAGNMAFREAALQSSDVGIEAAFIALPTIVASSKDANIANQYWAIRFDTTGTGLSAAGVPTVVNWANVPCRDNSNLTITCPATGYSVKYVIDRLCDTQTSGSTVVSNVQAYCVVDVGAGGAGTKKPGAPVFSSADAVYYRVTVQVTGPRNTTAYTQAILVKG
jgi:type IV pilus assembly protein PilX